MSIQRIPSGGEYELVVGYCRAVVAGGFIHLSGTVGEGNTVVEQCQSALETIHQTLQKAGADWEDVIRVVYMLPKRHDFAKCFPLLRQTFGAHPPAATMMECGLIDRKHLIEIQVTAKVPETELLRTPEVLSAISYLFVSLLLAFVIVVIMNPSFRIWWAFWLFGY